MSYKIVHIKGGDKKLEPYANFIRTGFLNSLRRGNKWFKKLDPDAYYAIYGAIVDNLLESPSLNFYLAVLSDEPDTALGWSLLDGKAIIYVFVKAEMRGNGIALSLIPDNYRETKRMRISVKFAELTDPLFMEGNLGKKLDPKTRTGLVMEYDTELRHLIVQYGGKVALVQHTHSMTVANPADIGISPPAPKAAPAPIPTWQGNPQVSNPTTPKLGATGQELSTLTGKKKPLTRAEIKEE